jgi:Rap1a immunity proteins
MKTYFYLLLCASITISTTPALTQTKLPSSIQQGTTILTLNRMCQEKPNSLQHAVCLAYLRGLFDGMQQAKIVEETKNNFCPPPSPDLDQMKLIIEQWVQNNPKNTSVSIGWAAPLALSLAFPCR